MSYKTVAVLNDGSEELVAENYSDLDLCYRSAVSMAAHINRHTNALDYTRLEIRGERNEPVAKYFNDAELNIAPLDFERLVALVDEKQSTLAKSFQPMFEKRGRELFERIAKVWDFRKLLMGMGTFTIDGDDFETVFEYDDKDEYEEGMTRDTHWLFDWAAGNVDYGNEKPVLSTPQLKEDIAELYELCGYVIDHTEQRVAHDFDIDLTK